MTMQEQLQVEPLDFRPGYIVGYDGTLCPGLHHQLRSTCTCACTACAGRGTMFRNALSLSPWRPALRPLDCPVHETMKA